MSTATHPKQPPVLNLPNILTTSRLGLAIVLFVLIEYSLWWASLGVFALAAFTDWLDGYLARKQGLTSTLGRNLDPLVDKVLTCGAYIFLLDVPNRGSGLWPWMVTVVVARELLITALLETGARVLVGPSRRLHDTVEREADGGDDLAHG